MTQPLKNVVFDAEGYETFSHGSKCRDFFYAGGFIFMRQYRTDLARDAFVGSGGMSGVVERVEQFGEVEVSRSRIVTEKAAATLGKPVGNYITIELTDMADADEIAQRIAAELTNLMRDITGDVLVIGLGNRFVTPDSLGPRTVDKVYVTRHIRAYAPELAPEGMRAVSAIAPGVLGVTGLETVEVVKGLIANARPAAVLCIDALASERVSRITSVVQLNDHGLMPGAGVGNRQQGLDSQTLGVPVFAIGVPTVVYAATIAEETIRLVARQTGVSADGGALRSMAGSLIHERMGNLVVTPKDVDKLVEDASKRLSDGINRALHGERTEKIGALLNT